MNIYIKHYLGALLFFSSGQAESHRQIAQISIPKSGTHLLYKCIRLLKGGSRNRINLIKDYIVSMEELERLTNMPFLLTHLFYKKEYAAIFKKKNIATLFLYRDPRDQIVSFAFFMLKEQSVWPNASRMNFDDLLLDIIEGGVCFDGIPPVKGIRELYASYLPWLNEPNVLLIRFEDLVGPKGGSSSAEIQLLTIKKIAQHIGIFLSEKEIYTVTDQLFGDSATFREGKVGSWKKHFKQCHIDAFKATAGDILIMLGCEQDLNW